MAAVALSALIILQLDAQMRSTHAKFLGSKPCFRVAHHLKRRELPWLAQGIRTPDIAPWQRFPQAPSTLATSTYSSLLYPFVMKVRQFFAGCAGRHGLSVRLDGCTGTHCAVHKQACSSSQQPPAR